MQCNTAAKFKTDPPKYFFLLWNPSRIQGESPFNQGTCALERNTACRIQLVKWSIGPQELVRWGYHSVICKPIQKQTTKYNEMVH